jgi:hypothetical protein
MAPRKGMRKDKNFFLHIPAIINTKGGRAGRRYLEARYVKRVRRTNRTINQMRNKDSSECQNFHFCLQM